MMGLFDGFDKANIAQPGDIISILGHQVIISK